MRGNRRLSPHFTLGQLMEVNVEHRGRTLPAQDTPGQAVVCHLELLCECYLEPLYQAGEEPRIRCAYLSKRLNDYLGEREDDWHTRGSAVDIYCDGLPHAIRLFNIIHKRFLYEGVGFDELFIYSRGRTTWLHVSYDCCCDPRRVKDNQNSLRYGIFKYNQRMRHYE